MFIIRHGLVGHVRTLHLCFSLTFQYYASTFTHDRTWQIIVHEKVIYQLSRIIVQRCAIICTRVMREFVLKILPAKMLIFKFTRHCPALISSTQIFTIRLLVLWYAIRRYFCNYNSEFLIKLTNFSWNVLKEMRGKTWNTL